MAKRCKEGLLFKRSDGILKDWKQYEFKLSQTYFHYFQVEKIKGQIFSCHLTKVEIPESKNIGSVGRYPFTVHFSCKGSPWILGATSEEERIAWMEALVPGSTASLNTHAKKYTTALSFDSAQSKSCDSQPGRSVSPHSQPGSSVSPHFQPVSPHSQPVSPHSQPGSSVSPQEVHVPPDTSQLPSAPSIQPPHLVEMEKSTSLPNIRRSEYHQLESVSKEECLYLEPVVHSAYADFEPVKSQDPGTGSSDVVLQHGSVKDTGLGDASAENMTKAHTEMLAQVLSRLNPRTNPAEALGTIPVQPPHLAKMIAASPGFEDSILSTDGDEPQPEWTRARTMTASSLDGDLSDLQRDALFISSSSLTDHVPIGKGQFGEVFRATLHKGTSGEVLVAVKTTKTNSTEKDRADFMKEMAVMSQILHPNIVRLYGLVNENEQSPSIVLEYLPNGDLKHFLMKNPRPVKQLVKYMIDVAMGMHYISEKGLVHRDLAARNVLVGENEVCKVADFGLLRELPEENGTYQSAANIPLPVRWMAPESIREHTFSAASDVWSYGILMWEMFNPGKVPYSMLSNMECVMEVFKGTRPPIPGVAPNIVARVMKSCWQKDPEKRPNFLVISTLLIAKGLVEAQ